jgi:hypothetical protein
VNLRTYLLTAMIMTPTWALAADLYVSTSGSDSNAGTLSAPLKTIKKASTLAKPGTVIHVAPGSYPGGFQTTASGTATARITYKSDSKWGAKITPSSSNKVMWDNRGNYTDIIGFDVDGSGSSITTNGIYIGGSYNLVQNNHVHHLATTTTCNSGGGSAIGTDHYYGGVNDDVIGNVVNNIGFSTCTFIQGIYISTSGNVKNNLAYQVGAAAFHLWHDASHVNIVNNTAASSGYGLIVGGGDFYSSTTRMADYCLVYSNIFFDNKYGVSEQGTTGPNNKYVNNLVYKNSTKDWDLDSGKTNTGSIAADPQFVSYNRTGASDFHLKSTSPAINSAIATLALSTDLDGMARPQGGGYDRGAYEYGGTSATPTPTPTPTPVPTPTPTPPPPSSVAVTLSATSLTFGPQAVGTTSAIQLVTLKNTGTAAITIPSAFVMTGDFAFGGTGTCTLTSYAPGASCTASVVFKPTATGTRTGTLSMLTSASSTPMVVKLTGNYVAPTPTPTPASSTVTLSATALTFASQLVGTTSSVQVVTLKNTGTTAFTIPSSFVMTGDFTFGGTGTCVTALSYAPGASCTASVVFKPTATGTRTGTLTLLTSASSTAMVVNLTGTGASISPTPTPIPSPTPAPSPTPTALYNLYVSPSGSDSNAGTLSAPLKTISRAAALSKPGTLVHVAAGTYTGNILTSASGTASARIRYVSDSRWAAKIVGTGTDYHWDNKGSYVDIVGFDVTGSGRGGILNEGSYTLVANNHVHNLAVSGGCTGGGGSAIMNGNYAASDGDIIGNVVHDVGVPGACNGIHGIYHANLRGKIMNNISYRNSAFGIHLWHAADQVLVVNNTTFANGSSSMGGGIVFGRGDTGAGILTNTRVANNIVFNNPRSGISEYCSSGTSCIGSGNAVANNLVYGNGMGNIYLLVGSATGTITADPQFVNYQANGSGDYHLKSTSPGIDKGSSTSAPKNDLDGNARPKGAGYDIGAYENY